MARPKRGMIKAPDVIDNAPQTIADAGERFDSYGKPLPRHLWKAGQSGNPSGVKKETDPTAYAKKMGVWVIDEWRKIVKDPKSSNELKNKALLNIMQYGFGKPVQSMKHSIAPPNGSEPDAKQLAFDKEINDAKDAAKDILSNELPNAVPWQRDIIDVPDNTIVDDIVNNAQTTDKGQADPFDVPASLVS